MSTRGNRQTQIGTAVEVPPRLSLVVMWVVGLFCNASAKYTHPLVFLLCLGIRCVVLCDPALPNFGDCGLCPLEGVDATLPYAGQ